MREKFPLRHFDYFANKNTFIGSCEHLRFVVKPSGEVFEVSVWTEDICLEKATISATESFPFTPKGLDQIPDWLAKQYLQPRTK